MGVGGSKDRKRAGEVGFEFFYGQRRTTKTAIQSVAHLSHHHRPSNHSMIVHARHGQFSQSGPAEVKLTRIELVKTGHLAPLRVANGRQSTRHSSRSIAGTSATSVAKPMAACADRTPLTVQTIQLDAPSASCPCNGVRYSNPLLCPKVSSGPPWQWRRFISALESVWTRTPVGSTETGPNDPVTAGLGFHDRIST